MLDAPGLEALCRCSRLGVPASLFGARCPGARFGAADREGQLPLAW